MSRARTLADQFNSDGNFALTPVASVNAGQVGGRRNLIINGAMQVNQRGFTSSSAAADNAFVADRFMRYQNGMTTGAGTTYYSTLSASDTPFVNGIKHAYRMQVTSAETSVGATVDSQVWFKLEAQDTDIAGWGTASAKTFTLSFWVKSHVTGKYYIWTGHHDGTTQNYCSPSYTINSANTWEHKTVTIPAFTDSDGVIQSRTIETGFSFTFYQAGGSNFQGSVSGTAWTTNTSDRVGTDQANMYASTGDFYLTGLQLELGSQATDFEHRSYGEELALCLRYYEQWDTVSGENIAIGTSYSGSNPHVVLDMKVLKRAAPTVTLPASGTSTGQIAFLTGTGSSPSTVGTHSTDKLNIRSIRVGASGYSGLSSSQPSVLYSYGGSSSFKFDAEL